MSERLYVIQRQAGVYRCLGRGFNSRLALETSPAIAAVAPGCLQAAVAIVFR